MVEAPDAQAAQRVLGQRYFHHALAVEPYATTLEEAEVQVVDVQMAAGRGKVLRIHRRGMHEESAPRVIDTARRFQQGEFPTAAGTAEQVDGPRRIRYRLGRGDALVFAPARRGDRIQRPRRAIQEHEAVGRREQQVALHALQAQHEVRFVALRGQLIRGCCNTLPER